MTPVLFLTMGRAAALAVRKWVVAPVTIGRAKSSSGISRSDVLARGCRLPLLFRAAPRWSRPSGGGCHDRPLVERDLPSPNREAAAPHYLERRPLDSLCRRRDRLPLRRARPVRRGIEGRGGLGLGHRHRRARGHRRVDRARAMGVLAAAPAVAHVADRPSTMASARRADCSRRSCGGSWPR
jgi:hypothetical protein